MAIANCESGLIITQKAFLRATLGRVGVTNMSAWAVSDSRLLEEPFVTLFNQPCAYTLNPKLLTVPLVDTNHQKCALPIQVHPMIKELGPFEDEAGMRSIAPVLQQWAVDVRSDSQVRSKGLQQSSNCSLLGALVMQCRHDWSHSLHIACDC